MHTKGKFLNKILTRMFKMVGRKYTPEATAKPNWYNESSWSRTQEAQYKAWLVKVIEIDLLYRPAAAERQAGWFILEYGWKVEEPGKPVMARGQVEKILKRTRIKTAGSPREINPATGPKEDFNEGEIPGTVCFVPDNCLINGKLNAGKYIAQGWAELNCKAHPSAVGRRLFPELSKHLR